MATQELYQHLLSFPKRVSGQTPIKVSSGEYIPLFCIGFGLDIPAVAQELMSIDDEVGEFYKRYGMSGWKSNPRFVAFIRECLQQGKYTVPMLCRPDDYIIMRTDLGDCIAHRASEFVLDKVSPGIRTPRSASVTTIEDIFKDIRMANEWKTHKLRGKASENTWYLTNFMFMASSNVFPHPTTGGLKIWFSMMVKRDDLAQLRAFFITNTAIPSSMVELWVDESMEAEGSKMKPHFRKLLKHRVEASGIEIKYFPDLTEELVEVITHPKGNKSLQNMETWKQSILEEMYDVRENKLEYWDIGRYNQVEPMHTFSKEISEIVSNLK